MRDVTNELRPLLLPVQFKAAKDLMSYPGFSSIFLIWLADLQVICFSYKRIAKKFEKNLKKLCDALHDGAEISVMLCSVTQCVTLFFRIFSEFYLIFFFLFFFFFFFFF